MNTVSSNYRGVFPHKNSFVVRINVGTKLHHVGIFSDEREAALNYDSAMWHIRQATSPRARTPRYNLPEHTVDSPPPVTFAVARLQARLREKTLAANATLDGPARILRTVRIENDTAAGSAAAAYRTIDEQLLAVANAVELLRKLITTARQQLCEFLPDGHPCRPLLANALGLPVDALPPFNFDKFLSGIPSDLRHRVASAVDPAAVSFEELVESLRDARASLLNLSPLDGSPMDRQFSAAISRLSAVLERTQKPDPVSPVPQTC